MASVLSWSARGKETDPWTYEWDESINPTPPTIYDIQPVSDGLYISCSGPEYAGALAKHVGKLPDQTPTIVSMTRFRFDTSIAYGQVIEIDRKITDAEGWTYDGSTQWNFAKGQAFEVDCPWVTVDGVVGKFAPDVWNDMEVEQLLDYQQHTLTMRSVTVNGQKWDVGYVIPAKQAGWAKSEIVTQLQLCTASKGGSYAVRFAGVGDRGVY
jgi:hypothetical protein